jgi:hypothetical protein
MYTTITPQAPHYHRTITATQQLHLDDGRHVEIYDFVKFSEKIVKPHGQRISQYYHSWRKLRPRLVREFFWEMVV